MWVTSVTGSWAWLIIFWPNWVLWSPPIHNCLGDLLPSVRIGWSTKLSKILGACWSLEDKPCVNSTCEFHHQHPGNYSFPGIGISDKIGKGNHCIHLSRAVWSFDCECFCLQKPNDNTIKYNTITSVGI